MEPQADELQVHAEWADEAVRLVHSISAIQQHNLLTHVFRTAAYVRASGDKNAAVALCEDLISTVDLRADADTRAALDDPHPPDRFDTVTIEKALATLRSH